MMKVDDEEGQFKTVGNRVRDQLNQSAMRRLSHGIPNTICSVAIAKGSKGLRFRLTLLLRVTG